MPPATVAAAVDRGAYARRRPSGPDGVVGRRAAVSCRPRKSARCSTAYRVGAERVRSSRAAPTRSPYAAWSPSSTSPLSKRDAVNRAKRALLDVLTASAGPLPPWATLLDRPDESIAALSDEEFVSGTPQQVAEQLIEQCQVIGAGHLLVAFSERDHERLEESHELFSSEVAPLLRDAPSLRIDR